MRYIACRDCEAMAPAVGRQEWAENAAIAAWNRRTDLCPSAGQEYAFGEASEYPFDALPAVMKERIRQRPLGEWAEKSASASAAA